MEGPAPSAPRGALFGWVARRPKLAFWLTAVIALVVGIGVGAAGGSDQTALDQAAADASQAKHSVSDLSRQLDAARTERDAMKKRLASADARAETADAAVEKLTAKAEVPDLTGGDAGEARGNDLVDQLGWKIRVVSRTTASAAPGRVLQQSPREGRVLKSGRSITLVIAKKPPPKPKQWVTIKTLQGASSTKTPEFHVPDGVKARLVYSMPQDSNNAITLYQAPKEYIDLLLNEIGPQHGSTRLYEPGTFYLDVDGAYTIQIQVFKRPA